MRQLKKCIFIFIFIILIQLPLSYVITANSNLIQLASNTSITKSSTNTEITAYSPACVLMEASTGTVIYSKEANKKMYPASTTKLMTAILAMEYCNLSDIATVSHNAIYSIPLGYAHASLREGEKFTIEQLLNVLLIPSANDAAIVIAEHISGSVEEFSNLMNSKAKEIGCTGTNFVNPNGIHHEDHYSTAHDLALIGQYAMKFSTITQITQKTQYTLPKTNIYNKEDRIFNTTNTLIKEDYRDSQDNYYYEYATGLKTGYTDSSKSCIVASARKDDIDFIVVVLGADFTDDGLSERFLDCINLFEYAFDNYTVKQLQKEDSILKQIDIPIGLKMTKPLDVIVKNDVSALVEKNKENVEPVIELNSDLQAPISQNSVIGKITYNVDGNEYSSDLIAGNNIEKSGFEVIVFRILLIFLILYIVFKLLKRTSKKSESKKGTKKKKYKKRKKNKKGKKKCGNFLFTQLNDYF